VFIYTCPPDSKIKEKMLYASCRASVVQAVEQECGLRISKKVSAAPTSSRHQPSHIPQFEAAHPDEIGEAQLIEEFHPKKEVKTTFARPKRPGRR
jgi:twinfilin-like protein